MNNLAPADLHSLRAGPFLVNPFTDQKKALVLRTDVRCVLSHRVSTAVYVRVNEFPISVQFCKTHVLNTRLTRSTASKAAYKLLLASNSQDVYCPETFPLRLVKFHLAMSLRPLTLLHLTTHSFN